MKDGRKCSKINEKNSKVFHGMVVNKVVVLWKRGKEQVTGDCTRGLARLASSRIIYVRAGAGEGEGRLKNEEQGHPNSGSSNGMVLRAILLLDRSLCIRRVKGGLAVVENQQSVKSHSVLSTSLYLPNYNEPESCNDRFKV